jgi:hypothetical protein
MLRREMTWRREADDDLGRAVATKVEDAAWQESWPWPSPRINVVRSVVLPVPIYIHTYIHT